jgi:CRISPR type IV-associated protein Csf3
MSDLNFEPLIVRAYMQTPIISDQFLPFDSVLYNQLIRYKEGRKEVTYSRESTVKEFTGNQLPIQKRNIREDDWYYASSFAVWHNFKQSKHQFAKRFDIDKAAKFVDFGGKKAEIDTKRGDFKNYFITEYTFNTEYVQWYLRGDRAALERYLPFITHLGKHSKHGCGRVLRWELEATDKDFYLNDASGCVMRSIPSHKGNFVYGIRPSYWHPRHQTKVLMPDKILTI